MKLTISKIKLFQEKQKDFYQEIYGKHAILSVDKIVLRIVRLISASHQGQTVLTA